MIDMPTRAQITEAWGGVGTMQSRVRSAQRDAQEEERRARLMRDAQPSGNESVQASISCPLGGTGDPVGTWVDFGRVAFTTRPNVAVGAATGWGPSSTEGVFGLARVDDWRIVGGLYRGAYVVCGAVGTVALATSMDIDVTFIGPALRLGG
jgi:hypothetical protein